MYTLRQRCDLGPLSQAATTDGPFPSEGSEERPSGRPMLEVSEPLDHSSSEAEERTTAVTRSGFSRRWTEQEDEVLRAVMQETFSIPERHRMFNERSAEDPRTLPAIRKRCGLLKNGTPLTNSLRLNMYSEHHISCLQELLLSQSDWDDVVNCFNQRFNVGLTKVKLKDVVERRKLDAGFRKVEYHKWTEAHDDLLRSFAQTSKDWKDCVSPFEQKFDTPRSETAIYHRALYLGLTGTGKAGPRSFSPEEKIYLWELTQCDITQDEKCSRFRQRFGDKRTISSIQAKLFRAKHEGKDPRLKKARSHQAYTAEEVGFLQLLAANGQVTFADAVAQFSEKFGNERTYNSVRSTFYKWRRDANASDK